MSLVAGIDYSTRAVDVVLLDEDSDRAEWHRFELSGPDAVERSRDVALRMPGRTASLWQDVVAFGIEEPRGYNAGALYRIQGAILSCLPRTRLVQPWVPSSWRKQVGLPGGCAKQDVASWAYRTLNAAGQLPGLDRWPQDALDAYAIATATRMVIQREQAA